MKKTLYDTLKETYKEQGLKVEEGSWMEPVGYKKPTMEYWIDVWVPLKDDKRMTLHYFFKNNKNVVESFDIFTSETFIEERNITKIH